MSERHEALDGQSSCYEIRLQGALDARWAAWFDGLSLTQAPDGVTVLRGPVRDQAALHGLLRKVRDLGLTLLAVRQLAADEPDAPDDANDNR